MASPVGHVLVGASAASVMARITNTPMTPVFWIGVIAASGLPDLDLLLGYAGLRGPRYHRNASHSLIVLGLAIAGAVLFALVVWSGGGTAVLACLGVSLISHPLVDVATTGPDLAARGYGIGLMWPLSKRRFFVGRPLVRTPELDKCDDFRQVVQAIKPELYILGPPAVVILVAVGLI